MLLSGITERQEKDATLAPPDARPGRFVNLRKIVRAVTLAILWVLVFLTPIATWLMSSGEPGSGIVR